MHALDTLSTGVYSRPPTLPRKPLRPLHPALFEPTPCSHLDAKQPPVNKAHCAGTTCPRRHSSAKWLRKSHQEALGKLLREQRIETSLLQGSHSTEDLEAVSERILSPLSGSCLVLPSTQSDLCSKTCSLQQQWPSWETSPQPT